MQEYVVGLAFSPDAKTVVLIEKQKPEWQVGLLNGVGGKIEAGEFSTDAMVREFEEETGVKTKPNDWEVFLVIRGEYGVVHFFRAFIDISGCRTVEKEEVLKYDLPSSLTLAGTVPNLQWIIPLALDNIEPFSVYDNGGSEAGKPSRLGQLLYEIE